MTRNNGILSLILLAAAILLSACAPMTIARIKQDPSRFQNKPVEVRGTVTNSVGVLATGGYAIDDGTGSIYVISNRGIPARGSKVTVKGTVFSGANILGQNYGVAIRESEHKVH